MSWEDKVRKVEPYVAGEQPKDRDVIKLNTNECPYPPAPGVIRAAEALKEHYGNLRLYPDMDASKLVNALADYYRVDPAQIFVGVGSDDVIAMSFMTFFQSGKKILFPDVTYSFYDVWAELYGIPYEQPALKEDFSIDIGDYLPEKTGGDLGGIIFPNPNAPTGLEMPLDQVEKIIAANPDWVCPMPEDEVLPDCGSICALLTASSGVKPTYIGKPNRNMIDVISKQTGIPNDKICAVGDRLYTDIAVAQNAGSVSVLVLSGETTPEMARAAERQPDYTLPSVKELLDALC